jgi:hypothetical protein
MQSNANLPLLTLIPIAFMLGCGSDVGNVNANSVLDGHDENPNEVMTTLKLTFTPADGGESFVITWADPELDGNPIIDDITLITGKSYYVDFEVFNELEDPTKDVTPEIKDEMDEHQVFFTGSAVEGPCNTTNQDALIEHLYEDLDNNGWPIGLTNTFIAKASGSGILSVLLRHMPAVNGTTVKTEGLAAVMDTAGTTALPGSTDINVDFNVTVD